MRIIRLWLSVWLTVLLLPLAVAAPQVTLLRIEGAITPATVEYVLGGLAQAAQGQSGLVVLEMDTPGGLDTSMRRIIKEILASPVPVAAFVYPSGARAASAGTYILYASHIAAMAPATNLGAATPVQIGLGGIGGEPASEPETKKKDDRAKEPRESAKQSTGSAMAKKQVHDASAYIRGLAQLRGRNAQWAERAVREAVSLSASEALKLNVIDLVATDVPDLLEKLHGRSVKAAGIERTLDTAGAETVAVEPNWRTRLLAVITDPSIALILMMIGIYGLLFEFSHPGFALPGILGGICLLLALYAFQLLPINYAGLGLILLGIALMVGEAFVPSFGVLGIGGIAAFVIGAVILIDADIPGYGVPLGLIVPLSAFSAVALFFVVTMALKARRRPVVSGRDEMIGASGEVLEDFTGEGWARVHSETWRVSSAAPLKAGQSVRVTGVRGLVLAVKPEGGES